MKSETELNNAIQTYGNIVTRICFIHLKQTNDIDDIFQSVFLKYYNSDPFIDANHEKAWIIRVSINACKDQHRAWFQKNVVLSDDLSIYEHQIEHDDDYGLLEKVLLLKDNYKNAIYLHYYEGYKVIEIAQILHKNENTIHTWLKRGRERLKEMLGGDYFE